MIHLYEPQVDKKDIDNVIKALNNNELSGNTQPVSDFEDRIKDYLSVKYALACSNGTTSLHLSLMAAGVSKGDEVIMPALTYIASANSISYIGAKPVLVDVDSESWQIDVTKINKKINNKTSAIMPVHLYGGVPELDELIKVAENNNLKIVHDSAESLGSKYKNIKVGKFNDVSSFSFFPNKIITTGEGGLLATDNERIYEKALNLRSQGLKGKDEYVHNTIGYNYRMSAINAALGINQVEKIDHYVDRKKEIYEIYSSKLTKSGVKFQNFNNNQNSSYWLTVAVFDKKIDVTDLKGYLESKEVETRRVFMPIHMQEAYRGCFENESFPVSESIFQNGLCLPSYPNLTEKNIFFIIDSIKEYLNS